MSPFNIFKKSKEKEKEEDYIEVVPVQETAEPKIWVRVFSIKDPADVKAVIDTLREGNTIVFADISELSKAVEFSELKIIINKIKTVVETLNGDIVGVDNKWIIATPSFAKIYRGKS